jgi:hypothetical protein
MLMKYYWYPALIWCTERDLTSKLSRYVIYDTLVQFGELSKFEDVEWKGVNEGVYLKNFLEKRQCMIEQDERMGDTDMNRVEMQLKLVEDKKFHLTIPLNVWCYGERFIIQ